MLKMHLIIKNINLFNYLKTVKRKTLISNQNLQLLQELNLMYNINFNDIIFNFKRNNLNIIRNYSNTKISIRILIIILKVKILQKLVIPQDKAQFC